MWSQSAKAISVAIILGYAIPLSAIWLLGFAVTRLDYQSILDVYGLFVVLYFFFFAPLFTSYLAARDAPRFPYYHGLAAVAVSMLLLFLKGNLQPLWIIPISLVLSVVGARRFILEKKSKNDKIL
jgi:hypothetical protein